MSLRIGQKGFFQDVYRTYKEDTVTNRDQAQSEREVEKRFRQFLHSQSSLGLE